MQKEAPLIAAVLRYKTKNNTVKNRASHAVRVDAYMSMASQLSRLCSRVRQLSLIMKVNSANCQLSMLRSRVQSLKVKEQEEVVLQVENLTLTNNPLTIISFFLMTAPVPAPAAAALPSEPCFSACHCFRPVSRYDCTRLRVFASCTREMLINTPALMTGIHAWGIPRGSWNRGFTCTAWPAQLRPVQHTRTWQPCHCYKMTWR